MFIFGILAGWKCDFYSFVNGSNEVNNFGYTRIGIRNICKYHHFLILKSYYYISNSRIPHIMSCISMSIYDNVICVLVSGVFHNVSFWHFGKLKMRFQLIRQQDFLRKNFGYTCIGISTICKYHLFLIVNSDC